MNTLEHLYKLYDHSLEDSNLSMYDRLPYDRDQDLCGVGSITLVSGNIIKYFRCEQKDAIPIENHDNDFMKRLQEKHRREERRKEILAKQAAIEAKASESELSEEQVKGLLGNNASEEIS